MKHSAELKESGFTISPKVALCEEGFHLEMYYVCEGSGLKDDNKRLFEGISEMPPG